MRRDRKGRREAKGRPEAGGRQPAEPRSPGRWTSLLPVLVALVLNVPSLGLGYFWDDFYFLSFKEHGGAWAHLFPEPQGTFYRPIPLGLYFKLLAILDPRNGAPAHLLNLAALCVAIVLLVTLVSRLYGPRAGLFSGLLFASYGNVPGLVAWTSGCQDLFAILFVTAALLLRHRGKDLAALACATAGVLCKEPAIAAFPVLILWDWILGRPPRHPKLQIIGYGLVAALWAVVHPGIHLLAGRGFKSGATMYVGLEHSERWGLYLWRYLMTLVNLPPPGLDPSWWEERSLYGFAALAILVAGLLALARQRRIGGASSCSLRRIGLISAVFVVPSLLMPAILVRHWAPYFACLPALGVALFLGPALARRGVPTAIAALSMFLLLGIWCRGARAEDEQVLTERAMVEASNGVRTVRSNFEKLFPTLPKGSEVLVSFGTSGIRGIQSALIEGQALRLWYRDPTLRTVRTRERIPGAPAEYLVRVTDDLDLVAFDPRTLRLWSATKASPNPGEIHRSANEYARTLAAGGDTDRAIRIMEGLTRIEPGELGAYNRRMIASMLLAAGRRREADSTIAAAPPFPRDVALALVFGLVADASPSERLDDAAFEAFGLSGSDPETVRTIMLGLEQNGSMAQAAWFALKLRRLAPGDSSSAELLERASRMGVTPQRFR